MGRPFQAIKGIGAVTLWLGLVLVIGFLGSLVSLVFGLGVVYVLTHHWGVVLLVLIAGLMVLSVVANW